MVSLEDELKELKKLGPAERKKRIIELEVEKKKEIDQAEKLLHETEVEIEDEEDTRVNLPAPQMRATDVDTLQTLEARTLWAAKRGVELRTRQEEGAEATNPAPAQRALEETVQAEKRQEVQGVQYGQALEQAKDTYFGNKAEMYKSPEAESVKTEQYRATIPGTENKSDNYTRRK